MELPDLGLASWSWFEYGHWPLICRCPKFWPSILIFKVQRTSVSFKSCLGFLRRLEVPDWAVGVRHLEHDLQIFRNIAWIFHEVFITLRSVKAKKDTARIESDQFRVKIQLSTRPEVWEIDLPEKQQSNGLTSLIQKVKSEETDNTDRIKFQCLSLEIKLHKNAP